MMRGLLKGAVAKKVFDEARKPHNQQKAKELFNSLRGKGGSTGSTGQTRRPSGR